MNIILLLDGNTSSGPSGIPVKFLKIALPLIIHLLVLLVSLLNSSR